MFPGNIPTRTHTAQWLRRLSHLARDLQSIDRLQHRHKNHRDRERLVPQLLDWGTNNVLVPNFLAIVFKKARNFTASSHQNAGFSIRVFKNFSGVSPRTLTTPSLAFGRARDASAPVLGPKPGPPQLFSRGCAPGLQCFPHYKIFCWRPCLCLGRSHVW